MAAQHAALSRSLFLVGCLVLSLSACTALSPYDTSAARVPRAPDGSGAPAREESRPAPPGREENAASAVLLERSRNERAAGSYGLATASIERALGIDPNNPLLWIELAEVKLEEGDREQAEMMARKALTLAGNDRSIRARAERLVGR